MEPFTSRASGAWDLESLGIQQSRASGAWDLGFLGLEISVVRDPGNHFFSHGISKIPHRNPAIPSICRMGSNVLRNPAIPSIWGMGP